MICAFCHAASSVRPSSVGATVARVAIAAVALARPARAGEGSVGWPARVTVGVADWLRAVDTAPRSMASASVALRREAERGVESMNDDCGRVPAGDTTASPPRAVHSLGQPERWKG